MCVCVWVCVARCFWLLQLLYCPLGSGRFGVRCFRFQLVATTNATDGHDDHLV